MLKRKFNDFMMNITTRLVCRYGYIERKKSGIISIKGFEHDLKEIKKDAKARFSLYKEVFDNKQGKLLLRYMDEFYSGTPDLTNDRVTYFNLGAKEVIRQTKSIIEK